MPYTFSRPSIGTICLAAFIALTGLMMLMHGFAIPAWFMGLLGIATGLFLLLGV